MLFVDPGLHILVNARDPFNLRGLPARLSSLAGPVRSRLLMCLDGAQGGGR